MKKLSEIYKELGIAFKFPIKIKDTNGGLTYCEYSDGYWWRCEYDANGNQTYYEDSCSFCGKSEYDANGNVTYYEDNNGHWERYEYDSDGNETYYEDSYGDKEGTPRSAKTCEGKVVEVDGIKYELKSL